TSSISARSTCRPDEALAGQRRGARREPVDAADPAVSVLGVPANRLQDAFLPRHARLPPRLRGELLVTDPECEDVAATGAEAGGDRVKVPVVRPVAVLGAEPDDELCPVAHRDVLALPVDIDVTRHALRSDCQVAADPVRAETEVAERFEIAELDRVASQ